MGTVHLIATATFPYAGRSLTPGDLFDAVSERDAETLRLLKKAEDAPRLRKAMVRKDLTAESQNEPSVERPKRQYQRRDLAAEE